MSPTPALKTPGRLAIVIGIDRYDGPIPTLSNARGDAGACGELLENFGYQVLEYFDEGAHHQALTELFSTTIHQLVGPEHELVIYYSGHGLATEDAETSLRGYLLPSDARTDRVETLIPMELLRNACAETQARHVLVVLDCCFAGAFALRRTKDIGTPGGRPLIVERFEKLIHRRSSYLIASASHDELALDRFAAKLDADRWGGAQHSPFATVFFRALGRSLDADRNRDGIVSASDLFSYLSEQFTKLVFAFGTQSPCMWTLESHAGGEHYFYTGAPILERAEALNERSNPYRGLQVFSEEHRHLFFGRDALAAQLCAQVSERRFTGVVGMSGAGKSSLIAAGLQPLLREKYRLIASIRPGPHPHAALQRAMDSAQADDGREGLLVIDQLEETITLCRSEEERDRFFELLIQAIERGMRAILCVRIDYEPHLARLFDSHGLAWDENRFLVAPMQRHELRQCIEGPAAERIIFFDARARYGRNLVETLLEECDRMPGALPLLSVALSEMYLSSLRRAADDRTISWEDYESVRGVAGALQSLAEQTVGKLQSTHGPDLGSEVERSATLRAMLLRMVSVEGGEIARRTVTHRELQSGSRIEDQRIVRIAELLVEARLLVGVVPPSVSQLTWSEDQSLEPAHDYLVKGWPRLVEWIDHDILRLHLIRRLDRAMDEVQQGSAGLWADSRLEEVARVVLQIPEDDRAGFGARAHRYFKSLFRDDWFLNAARPHMINAKERIFLASSLRARRRARLTAVAASCAIVVFLVATAAVLASLWTETRTLLARSFYDQSTMESEADWTSSMLHSSSAYESLTPWDDRRREYAVSLLHLASAAPKRVLCFDHQLDLTFNPAGDSALGRSRGAPSKLYGVDTRSGDIRELAIDAVQTRPFYAPSGRWLAIPSGEKKLTLFDGRTFELRRSVTIDGNVERLAFTNDDALLMLVRSGDRLAIDRLRLEDRSAEIVRSFLPIDGASVEQAALSEDGKTWAAIVHHSDQRELLLHEVGEDRQIWRQAIRGEWTIQFVFDRAVLLRHRDRSKGNLLVGEDDQRELLTPNEVQSARYSPSEDAYLLLGRTLTIGVPRQTGRSSELWKIPESRECSGIISSDSFSIHCLYPDNAYRLWPRPIFVKSSTAPESTVRRSSPQRSDDPTARDTSGNYRLVEDSKAGVVQIVDAAHERMVADLSAVPQLPPWLLRLLFQHSRLEVENNSPQLSLRMIGEGGEIVVQSNGASFDVYSPQTQRRIAPAVRKLQPDFTRDVDISPNLEWIVLHAGGGGFGAYHLLTGQHIYPRIWYPYGTKDVSFTSDSKAVQFEYNDGTYVTWTMQPERFEAPAWINEIGSALSGHELTRTGDAICSPRPLQVQRRRRLEEDLAKATASGDPAARFLEKLRERYYGNASSDP